MSGLAALLAGHTPPGVYQWHSAAPMPDVQHAVEKAGWHFCYLDGWTVEDRESFLKGACACLDATEPAEDMDGLSAALDSADVGECGLVLLWDGWSPLARHDEATFKQALDVFRGRSASSANGSLAVIMRGDGPRLELEELPIKH